VPLKNRIGAFFLLTGVLFLFIFATSVFSPTGDYQVLPLLGGAALVVMGWRWRTAKRPRPAGPPPSAAPAAAPKAGPPPAKKQGPLATLLKGPASKKMAPKPAAPAGPPPGGKGGGGKPGGGKPGGKPKGKK
jgi:23S rRNA pseudouridine2605 synthase